MSLCDLLFTLYPARRNVMSSDTAAFSSRTSTSSIFFEHNQMFYRSGVFSGTLSHCSPTARRLYRLRRLAALHTASTSASLSSIFFDSIDLGQPFHNQPGSTRPPFLNKVMF
jgi:hypothetical protein